MFVVLKKKKPKEGTQVVTVVRVISSGEYAKCANVLDNNSILYVKTGKFSEIFEEGEYYLVFGKIYYKDGMPILYLRACRRIREESKALYLKLLTTLYYVQSSIASTKAF